MDNLIIFSRDLSRHPLSLFVRLSISVVCAAVIVHDHTATRQNCFRRRSIVFRELLSSRPYLLPPHPPQTHRTNPGCSRAFSDGAEWFSHALYHAGSTRGYVPSYIIICITNMVAVIGCHGDDGLNEITDLRDYLVRKSSIRTGTQNPAPLSENSNKLLAIIIIIIIVIIVIDSHRRTWTRRWNIPHTYNTGRTYSIGRPSMSVT